MVTVGSQAILIRSETGAGGSTAYVDGYDPTSNAWRDLPDYHLPAGQKIMQVVALPVASSLVLWSEWSHSEPLGHNSFESSAGVDAARLDPARTNWTTFPITPDQGESAEGAAWTGSSILLPQAQPFCGLCIGGIPGPTITSVMRNTSTGQRVALPVGPASIPGARLIWTGSAVLSLGASQTGARTPVAAAWNPPTNAWTTVPAPPAIEYVNTVSIWTGKVLILWGYADSRSSPPGVEFTPR